MIKNDIPLKSAPGITIVTPYHEENAGGFAAPSSEIQKDEQSAGLVLETSDKPYISEYGATVPNPGIKPGDVIIHRRWGHEDKKWNGVTYRLVKHVDIFAIISKEKLNK